MTPLECVRKVIECDNGRDAAGYRALLHDDYVARVHGSIQTEGADAEVAGLEAWWAATPDSHLEELATHVDGPFVTLRYALSGTNDGPLAGNPPTGKAFRTEACTILEVRNGRVKNTWRFADTLGMFTQLGLMGGG
jgi:predicted ester cyclase